MRSLLRTDIGRVRKANEDAAYIGQGLYILCDGMGGHKAGDVASNMAVDLLSAALEGKTPGANTLRLAVESANEQISQRAQANKEMRGMGTTLTALWAAPDGVLLAQVGDSRAYLLREGTLQQITHDHSMVAELVRAGQITAAEARVHPYKNLVTRALGTEMKVRVDLFEMNRQAGDRWLLCSDGLTDLVEDQELENILKENALYDAGDTLLTLALERGGIDNITLLLMDDEGGGAA